MPFTPITDTVKVEIVGHDTITLQPIVNVLHALLADASQSLVNVQAIANEVKSVLLAATRPTPSTMSYDSVIVTGLAFAGSNQAISLFPSPTIGGGTADAVPGVCMLTKLNTALRSRSGRGRIYWGPVPSDQIVSGSGAVSAGFRADMDTIMSAIQSGLQGLTPASDLVVASRHLGLSHIVTSFSEEVNSAFQRRRSGR